MDLLERAKEGDEDAIRQIYLENKDFLFAYALNIFKDKDTAEEVVSQTFEKFLTVLPTIKSGNLAGWLFITARNVILDMFKDKGRDYEKLEDRERRVSEFNPTPSLEELSYLKKDGEELID